MGFQRSELLEAINSFSFKANLGFYEPRIEIKNCQFLAKFSFFIIYSSCIYIVNIIAVPFDSHLISMIISLFKIVVAILEVIL
jgi:hypothetical protein